MSAGMASGSTSPGCCSPTARRSATISSDRGHSSRAAALDPEWLPHSFDGDGRRIAMIHVPRDMHDSLTFLNDQNFGNRFDVAIHDSGQIASFADTAPEGPLHFIFHTAFCGSTLLTKALTVPGKVMGLKEPIVLNDLALRTLRNGPSAEQQRLRLMLRLLARPFDEHGAVIVKPSNVANRLLAPTLETRPKSRAILLHSDLPGMLLGVAKAGLERRQWVRQLYVSLSQWAPGGLGQDPEKVIELADLPLAALAWFMQIRHFREIARRFGSERVMMVDCARLMARPHQTLSSVADFLELGLDAATIDRAIHSEAFRTHSKFVGMRYNMKDRERDLAEAKRAYGREIKATITWLENLVGRSSADSTRTTFRAPPTQLFAA